MKDQNIRKALIIILVIATLGIIGVLIVTSIQNNNALQNSEAAGFGSSATTDNFQNVYNAFVNISCGSFYQLGDFNLLPEGRDLKTLEITSQDPQSRFPVDCTYTFNNGKKIILELHTYDKNSKIDNSQQQLFDRINSSTLSSIIATGDLGYQNTYFFGIDEKVSGRCRGNIFNGINDYEYGSLIYEGFGNCNSIKNLNEYLINIIALKAVQVVEEPNLSI